MEKLVSIIIPVYNVQNYLQTCLNSLKSQTYKNIEVILVNDGSKDDSCKICEEFVFQDKRFKLFDKENGGVSSARNMGLDNATGDYVTFIDSDDWVEPYYIEIMIEKLMETNSDVAITRFIREYNKKKFIKRQNFNIYVYDKIETLREMFSYRKFSGQPTKLFKMEYIKNLRFDSTISYGEDTLFSYEYIKKIDKTCFIDAPLYHYVQSKNSIVRSKFNSKKLSLLTAVEIMLKECEVKFPEVVPVLKGMYCLISFELLWYVVSSRYKDKEIKKKLKLNVKENIKDLKQNKEFSWFYRHFLGLGFFLIKAF